MSALHVLSIVVPALLASAVHAAGPDVQEGRWETTVRVIVDDIAFPAPFTTEKCITAQDLIPNSVTDGAECVIENIETVGNDVSWSINCADAKGTLHGHGIVTYAGKTLQGAMEMVARDAAGNVLSKATYEMKGERKGDCK